jgi:hypothetical protein
MASDIVYNPDSYELILSMGHTSPYVHISKSNHFHSINEDDVYTIVSFQSMLLPEVYPVLVKIVQHIWHSWYEFFLLKLNTFGYGGGGGHTKYRPSDLNIKAKSTLLFKNVSECQ